MSPVRSVTYVSGRSASFYANNAGCICDA